MSLEEYFCEYLELEFRFPLEDFDKDAFLNDVQSEDKSRYSWLFGSTERPNQQHANIRIHLLKDGQGTAAITFHKADLETKDTRPPYMEDCAQWLGKFLKTDEVTVQIRMIFNFDKRYEPIFALPFPLFTESKILLGSVVVGVSMELPLSTRLEKAAIQKAEDHTVILATTTDKVKLRTFNLKSELEKRSTSVQKLLRKAGANDDPES